MPEPLTFSNCLKVIWIIDLHKKFRLLISWGCCKHIRRFLTSFLNYLCSSRHFSCRGLTRWVRMKWHVVLVASPLVDSEAHSFSSLLSKTWFKTLTCLTPRTSKSSAGLSSFLRGGQKPSTRFWCPEFNKSYTPSLAVRFATCCMATTNQGFCPSLSQNYWKLKLQKLWETPRKSLWRRFNSCHKFSAGQELEAESFTNFSKWPSSPSLTS